MRPVSGLAILSLNPSLQMKLTDDYAAVNTDAHKSPIAERPSIRTFQGAILFARCQLGVLVSAGAAT
jgi:hypothetical protein